MLGDLLMMTPTIRRIKTLYPNCKVYLLTDDRLKCLFSDNPYLDGVNQDKIYDIVIDFAKKYNSTIHNNKIKFYFNVANNYIDLKLNELKDEDFKYDLKIKESENVFGKYALFSPFCAGKEWKGRELKDATPYKELIKNIDMRTMEVMWGDRKLGGCDFTLPPIKLEEFIKIVNQAKLVVTIDTGTLHIAQALNKPIIAIFGKVVPESRIIPGYKKISIVKKDIPCIGCFAKNRDISFCDNDEDCMYLEKDALIKAYQGLFA